MDGGSVGVAGAFTCLTGDHRQFEQITRDHSTPIAGKLPTMSVVLMDMNSEKKGARAHPLLLSNHPHDAIEVKFLKATRSSR